MRQAAQFAMVAKGADALDSMAGILKADADRHALHALWGLGQLYRNGCKDAVPFILESLTAENAEIRANAARMCGDISLVSAKDSLLSLLEDKSPRVVSLATIALGRVALKVIRR